MNRMPPVPLSPSPRLPLSPSHAPRRVAIIGGGISGLAAAHRLIELDPAAQITLFEASGRVGGVLQTNRRDGWLIERSADMFTTREPWALDLCRRIGIENELIETDTRYRRAFVVHRGRLIPVPDGFTLMSPAKVWPILKTPLLSPLGKLRMGLECLIPPRRDTSDESLESFVVRRFGREAFDRLIQPLIGGIYTADPAKLSMAATLPQFLEMEKAHGSLIRAMQSQRSEVTGQRSDGTSSGARYGMFLAPRGGMQRLVEAIAARLPAGCIRLNSSVEMIERCRERPPWRSEEAANDVAWRIQLPGESAPEYFDDLIVASPGAVSSRLLKSVDEDLASLIGQIPHAGCSVAVLGVRRDQIRHPLDGFGFVVPRIESRRIIAGSLASIKFPGRAPEGKVLLRVFVGGALQPELGQLPDAEIQQLVREELADLIGFSGEPEFSDIVRWQCMMPQYHIGHLDRVAKIEQRAAAIPHFALAGNAYRGVGIPFCIHSGEQAAERLCPVKMLTGTTGK
jgi:protoporphyrinogen/coproporphyrinogen III oxidase